MRSRFALALTLALALSGSASAEFIIRTSLETNIIGGETQPDGSFLSFGQTSNQSTLPDPSGTTALTEYTGLSGQGPTDADGETNRTANYSLIIDIINTETNDIGTIDLGGTGQGGIRSTSNTEVMDGTEAQTFIDDTFNSLNGANISGSNPILLSYRLSNNRFLNVRLFDPNPRVQGYDVLSYDPTEGISLTLLGITNTRPSGYLEIQTSPVPEPATLTSLGIGGVLLAFRGLRRRKSAVAA